MVARFLGQWIPDVTGSSPWLHPGQDYQFRNCIGVR